MKKTNTNPKTKKCKKADVDERRDIYGPDVYNRWREVRDWVTVLAYRKAAAKSGLKTRDLHPYEREIIRDMISDWIMEDPEMVITWRCLVENDAPPEEYPLPDFDLGQVRERIKESYLLNKEATIAYKAKKIDKVNPAPCSKPLEPYQEASTSTEAISITDWNRKESLLIGRITEAGRMCEEVLKNMEIETERVLEERDEEHRTKIDELMVVYREKMNNLVEVETKLLKAREDDEKKKQEMEEKLSRTERKNAELQERLDVQGKRLEKLQQDKRGEIKPPPLPLPRRRRDPCHPRKSLARRGRSLPGGLDGWRGLLGRGWGSWRRLYTVW